MRVSPGPVRPGSCACRCGGSPRCARSSATWSLAATRATGTRPKRCSSAPTYYDDLRAAAPGPAAARGDAEGVGGLAGGPRGYESVGELQARSRPCRGPLYVRAGELPQAPARPDHREHRQSVSTGRRERRDRERGDGTTLRSPERSFAAVGAAGRFGRSSARRSPRGSCVCPLGPRPPAGPASSSTRRSTSSWRYGDHDDGGAVPEPTGRGLRLRGRRARSRFIPAGQPRPGPRLPGTVTHRETAVAGTSASSTTTTGRSGTIAPGGDATTGTTEPGTSSVAGRRGPRTPGLGTSAPPPYRQTPPPSAAPTGRHPRGAERATAGTTGVHRHMTRRTRARRRHQCVGTAPPGSWAREIPASRRRGRARPAPPPPGARHARRPARRQAEDLWFQSPDGTPHCAQHPLGVRYRLGTPPSAPSPPRRGWASGTTSVAPSQT